MANEQENPIMGSTSAISALTGVKYFKLPYRYPGDETRGCGLLGEEIDKNFYFLRGYDISAVTKSDDAKEIVLTRLNGEQMHINVAQDFGEYTIKLDSNNGILTLIGPTSARSQSVDGLLTKSSDNFKVATNGTIIGDGTKLNPIGVAATLRTGEYAPADILVDLTEDGSQLPEIAEHGQGYRVVSRRYVNSFGFLYNYNGIQEVKAKLAQSGWRIPTKEDYDKIFDYLECPPYDNHKSTVDGIELGQVAGRELKSASGNVIEWKVDARGEIGNDSQGFGVLPVGWGISSTYRDPDDNYHIGNTYKQEAALWTDTEVNNAVWGKKFTYNRPTIIQSSFDKHSWLSLRLVKDSNYNFSAFEDILGEVVPCVQMKFTEQKEVSDGSGGTIVRTFSGVSTWTKINVAIAVSGGNYGSPKLWKGDSGKTNEGLQPGYFVSEWNGEYWEHRQMKEGESVVLINSPISGNGRDCHQWRVMKQPDGTYALKDTLELLEIEIEEILKDALQKIKVLSGNVETLSAITEGLKFDVMNISGATVAIESGLINVNNRVDNVETELDVTQASAGFTSAGTYIPSQNSNYISGATNIKEANEMLDDAIKKVDDGSKERDGKISSAIGLTEDYKVDLIAPIYNDVDESEVPEEWKEAPFYTEKPTVIKRDELYIRYINTSAQIQYAKLCSQNAYVTSCTTVLEAIHVLDNGIEGVSAKTSVIESGLAAEIIRATAVEAGLRTDLTNLSAASVTNEANINNLSAATVENISRLEGRDIAYEQFDFSFTPATKVNKLKRVNGNEIEIRFDFDFGEF